jgi:rRNA-processing protein FCF1
LWFFVLDTLTADNLSMDAARLKEIMSHAEVQFNPERNWLRDWHQKELREARFRASETHNAAAMLPAEAECYIAHTKALVIARAKCIADAYTAFNEPAGQEADTELQSLYSQTVAARKASFQGEVELRRLRTRKPMNQLVPLLRRFERDAHSALVEGKVILDRQRLEMRNRTRYVVDTSVFNWLANSSIEKSALPSDGGFAITHVQMDEINKTKDEERRVRLLLVQASLHCKLLPTQTFLADVSRLDHAMMSDGKLFTLLRSELDSLNGNKHNNARDALIAEVAIANRYTLLTADEDLKSVTEKHGGEVIFFRSKKG